MRTIIFYLNLIFSFLCTLPNLIRYNNMKKRNLKNASLKSTIQGSCTISKGQAENLPEEIENFAYETVQKFAKSQIKCSGANIQIIGNENVPTNESVVFVSNHQGNFDFAIFLAIINKNKGFVAKIETTKIPFLKEWMYAINCVFMDRKDIRQSAKAINEGIVLLKNGKSLVIFPEGTRSKSNQVAEFKAGSFKLATKARVCIVPVSINGTYKIMEANGGKIKKADVTVVVHKAIPTENLTQEEAQQLPEMVRDIIINGLK